MSTQKETNNVVTTKIVKVIANDNFADSAKRLTCIVEHDENCHIDEKGNTIKDNRISFNPAQILNLDDSKVTGNENSKDIIDVLNYKSLGRAIKREIWGALLKNSSITYNTTKHSKGEKRQNGEIYTADCFVTEIQAIELAEIRPIVMQLLAKDLENPFESKQIAQPQSAFRSTVEVRL